MKTGPDAMILCAGLGTRMRPLTNTTPKPLIKVADKPLVQYAYDNLRRGNVGRIVVNVHYLAGQVEQWVKGQRDPGLLVSDERKQLLDTGGGVSKALQLMTAQCFYVLNADSFWIDTNDAVPALDNMKLSMKDGAKDFALLLARRENATGYNGKGDFFCDTHGRLERRGIADSAPYVYAGCYLASRAAYRNVPRGAFSANMLWDRAIAEGRAKGIVLDGHWFHVGTPQAIAEVERVIKTITR